MNTIVFDPNHRSWRRLATFAAILLTVIAMAGFFSQGRFKVTSVFTQAETVIWYCAGEAVNAHSDPYLVEPLRACEIRDDPGHARVYPWVEPAPLPGYVLAGFGLLARLPFPVTRVVWYYLLVVAVIITAVLIARLARVPTLLTLLCLAPVDGYLNLFYGEIPPLAVLALVASASLGASRRYTAAAIVGALTMIEPHIGLPACVSMFVWWPRTRLPFVISAAILAGISVSAIGVGANIEYFHTVLPLHAASEIAAQDQFSLTRVLHILGFPDRVALTAGSASYLIMTILGVAVAKRLAESLRSPALVALQPSAMALLGGPFVHDLQMAAAIPAAVLLATSPRFPAVARAAALVAVVFPWNYWGFTDGRGQLAILETAAIAGALFTALHGLRAATRAVATAGGVAIALGLASLIAVVPQQAVGPHTVVTPLANRPTDIGSKNWAAFVSRDAGYSTPDARDITQKIPVWLGLMAIAAMGIEQACRGVAMERRALDPAVPDAA